MKWLAIIGRILIIIASGTSRSEAVSKAARAFGVSESEIWANGGF